MNNFKSAIMKENIIVEKTYHFAVEMTEVCKKLKDKKEFHLASQLLRSATSIGANVREATAAQTKRDFIAKMSIASKEAREANYWINIIKDSHIMDLDYSNHMTESEEIIKILTAILKTSKSK
jgi:four helix bundle protein